MCIEAIQREDIPACLAIYNHYILHSCHTLEETALTEEQFSARVSRISERYPYLVAKSDDGRVIGYAYLDVFNERSAYRATADLSIYVHPDFRRAHVGGKMLAALETQAIARGIDTLVSIITDTNADSVRFHEHYGFVREGWLRDVACKFGEHVGVFFYRKALLGARR